VLLATEHVELGARLQAEHFPFLNGPGNGPFRTLYYASLARLLFLDDTTERFESFIAPLVAVLQRLHGMVHVRTPEVMVRPFNRRFRR
jgi:hypothetical protein